MKKIKNKFIIGVILVVIFILSFQIYQYNNISSIDRNSYVVLIKGEGTINKKVIYKDNKQIINIGDEIKSIGKKSILVIEWGDGSITRLGGNTNIVINENNISQDLTKINVSFNLLNGKTWSNVISFMGKDSHFKEYFNDIEAGIRGTVFDVNLENNYIFVTDHEVSLKVKNGKIYKIGEGKPFSIKNLNFIEIKKFISELKDTAWSNLNTNFDKEFINKLKKKLQDKIKNNNSIKALSKIDINSLNIKEKQDAYNELLSRYQEYNFIKASDEELFKRKMEIKTALISLANKEDKNALLKTFIYDVNSAIYYKKEFLIKEFIPLLKEYKKLLPIIELKKFNEVYSNINNFIGKNDIGDKVRGFIKGAGDDINGKINNLINTFKK